MDIITTLFILLAIVVSYKIGQLRMKAYTGNLVIQDVIERARIPIAIIDQIDGHYYIYDKDTNDFLCQSDDLMTVPKKLLDTNKISLAVIMYPEEEYDQKYWCINGKLKAFK